MIAPVIRENVPTTKRAIPKNKPDDPFSALFAAARGDQVSQDDPEETSQAPVQDDKPTPLNVINDQPTPAPTSDDFLFLGGGSASSVSPPVQIQQERAVKISTLDLFGAEKMSAQVDDDDDDDDDETPPDVDNDDDFFSPPPAAASAPQKEETKITENVDEEARIKEEKRLRRKKKEEKARKAERRRKRTEEKRIAQEREQSRNPNTYSSYYSRGGTESSSGNDKWRGISSSDVGHIGEAPTGFGHDKYKGFGNYDPREEEESEGSLAKVGGAALGFLSSAKDLVSSMTTPTHAEIGARSSTSFLNKSYS